MPRPKIATPPDRLYLGGCIYTYASEPVEAIEVTGGRISGLGDADDLLGRKARGTEIIDLEGATVLPGFIETHMHPVFFGIQEQQLVIPDSLASIAEVVALLDTHAATLPPESEVLAWRFDHTSTKDQRHITTRDLDQVRGNHSIVVRHVSGHIAYGNSAALSNAGINSTTPDPPGGEIVRDEAGNPSGQLNELSAMALVTGILPNLNREGNLRALTIAQNTLLSVGVTTVHDLGVWSDEYFDAYAGALARDELTVRTRLYAFVGDLDHIPVPPTTTGDRMTFGGIKFAIDGMLLGQTAHVREPYCCTHETGVLLQTPEELNSAVAAAHQRGYQVAIHAEGDGALDQALDAIELATLERPRADHRHRVEHVEIVHPDQIERMAHLGVTASLLLNGIHRWGDELLGILGTDRVRAVSPLRSLRNHHVPTALHSDCPITPVNPLHSIATAVTRASETGQPINPEQAVTVDEAIRGLTSDAAFIGFEEADKGTLEVGKLADLVALSEDPHLVSPSSIAEIEVTQTIIDGAVVWEA